MSLPYSERRDTSQRLADQLTARSRTFGRIRLAIFALLGVAVWFALTGVLPWVLPIVLLAGFAVLVRVHARVNDKRDAAQAGVRLQELRIAAAERLWKELPDGTAERKDLPHWADELDVVGDASIFRILKVGLTLLGSGTVESWLLAPAGPEEVRSRQEAVKELASNLDQMDAVQTLALQTRSSTRRSIDPLLEWAESEQTKTDASGRALVGAAHVVALSVVTTMLLGLTGVIDIGWMFVAAIVSLAFSGILAGRSRRFIDNAQGHEGPIESFSRMIKLVEQATFASTRLSGIQQSLRDQSALASDALMSLRRILALAEVKYSPAMYAVLQVVLVWDVHVAERLHHWRREHGMHVRRWLASLGEVEALVALAALAHANPDWCYPEVADPHDPNELSGEDVAHPLIAPEARVGNDVTAGPPGTFLLVTGSNMSGKSTLLRSIGLNTILAQAGAPVCARKFRMPSVVLATSVQVQDSLAKGVSRFMAELLRLKDVIDLVRTSDNEVSPMPLYLLDEILQGTNTAERQVGARMVIRQLLRSRCIGVVTTHDLALADSPDIDSLARKVHFAEGVDEQEGRVLLSFEYKLQPGIATSVNALKLMRAVGLT